MYGFYWFSGSVVFYASNVLFQNKTCVLNAVINTLKQKTPERNANEWYNFNPFFVASPLAILKDIQPLI
jgi:hypothetical protein